MTFVSLNLLNASGPLEGFGQLTALTDLRLASNRFSGVRECCLERLHQASCSIAP